MIIFCGNELTLGIIFVNWLLCLAIGSWGFGRLADRPGRKLEWLVMTYILASVILPTQILLTRNIGSWIVAERGEAIGLFSTFYSTFLALFPHCSLNGFQFSLGCRLYAHGADPDKSSVQISVVYVLESLGAMIGGLVFTYLLVHYFHVLEICVSLSLLNLFLALFLQRSEEVVDVAGVRKGLLTGIIILLIVLNMSGIVTGKISDLHVISYRQQWEKFDLVHYENSIYGNIVITESEGQLDFWVNGLTLFTTPDPDIAFVEEVAHFPMLQHPSPERVLLIGGGVGGVLEEILKHPVKMVSYVELDPLIIELTRKYSQEASMVLDDPRVGVIHTDGRLFVKRAEYSYDVIIVNLPSPSSLQLNRFYSLEFFREVHEILGEEGVFSIGLPSSMTLMMEEMGARNRCVYETIKEVFPSCLVVPGYYNIFLASPSKIDGELTPDASILAQRLLDRGLETSLFTEEYIQYKFSPERVELGLAYLSGDGVKINRDLRPAEVYYDLTLWNAMFNQGLRAFLAHISRVEQWWFMVPLGLSILALVFMRRRLRSVWIPVSFTIMTTGFAGMTFSIVLIFAFQVAYGYIYQELGVVSAAFMLGLALGGSFMSHAIPRLRKDISTLTRVELAIIAYSFLLPLVIKQLLYYSGEPFVFPFVRILLPILNGAAGFLVGLEFPLASKICLEDRDRIGRVAGSLYAFDLIGACAGALLSSVWLIPLLGVHEMCLVVAMLNATSLALLIITGRFS